PEQEPEAGAVDPDRGAHERAGAQDPHPDRGGESGRGLLRAHHRPPFVRTDVTGFPADRRPARWADGRAARGGAARPGRGAPRRCDRGARRLEVTRHRVSTAPWPLSNTSLSPSSSSWPRAVIPMRLPKMVFFEMSNAPSVSM